MAQTIHYHVRSVIGGIEQITSHNAEQPARSAFQSAMAAVRRTDARAVIGANPKVWVCWEDHSVR